MNFKYRLQIYKDIQIFVSENYLYLGCTIENTEEIKCLIIGNEREIITWFILTYKNKKKK